MDNLGAIFYPVNQENARTGEQKAVQPKNRS